MSADTYYDCVIVGGGLVGMALALALSPLKLRIALIDPKPIAEHATDSATDFDRRAIALSQSSINILKSLSVWPACEALTTPIKSIHISEKGRYGKTRLHCRDQQLPYFGRVIPMASLHAQLEARCATLSTLTQYRPDSLKQMHLTDGRWHCQLENKSLTADCLIACDGSRSFVREQLGIGAEIKKLTQVAVLANVTTTKPMANTAYQRFTECGPVALLPIGEYAATAVITTSAEEATILADDPEQFVEVLQTRFGLRLGRFTEVGRRQSHPLIRLWAERVTDKQALLLGNAAHTLHPVAAQSFNLSLRDVAVFAEQIAAESNAIDWQECLKKYDSLCEYDQWATSELTEQLLSIFSMESAPVAWARSLGLHVLDHIPPLKNRLSRLGMGLSASGSQRLIYGKSLIDGGDA